MILNVSNADVPWIALTALGSLIAAIATIYGICKTTKTQKEVASVDILLRYENKFESKKMRKHRKGLASTILNDSKDFVTQGEHESVLDFFESIGMLMRKKYLDPESIWVSFGYYIIRWRKVCQNYINHIRTVHHDNTLYEEFEYLADKICKIEEKKRNGMNSISKEELDNFLREELTA